MYEFLSWKSAVEAASCFQLDSWSRLLYTTFFLYLFQPGALTIDNQGCFRQNRWAFRRHRVRACFAHVYIEFPTTDTSAPRKPPATIFPVRVVVDVACSLCFQQQAGTYKMSTRGSTTDEITLPAQPSFPRHRQVSFVLSAGELHERPQHVRTHVKSMKKRVLREQDQKATRRTFSRLHQASHRGKTGECLHVLSEH